MAKLIVIPFAGEKLVTRARTSVADTATLDEITAKVQSAMERGGKSVTRIWVTTQEDQTKPVVADFEVQDGKPVLVGPPKPEPVTAQESNDDGQIEEDGTMAKKSKKKSTKAKGARKPGVISKIVEMISRPQGATIPQIVTVLKAAFPDRKEKGMTTTAKIQANKNSTTKDKNKNGDVVYYKKR